MNRILILLAMLVAGSAYALPQCPPNDYRGPCFGTYTYKNGGKYVGEYKDRKRHGLGVYWWANTDKKVGEYKDDKMYLGIFYLSSGQIGGTYSHGNWCQECTVTQAQQEKVLEVIAYQSAERKRNDKKIIAASSGTGFFVSQSGHVVTNHHVIEECKSVKVSFKGNEVKANVVAVDKHNDLAILKTALNPNKVFPVSQEDAALLDDVVIAGYPLGKDVSSAIKTSK